VLIKFNNSIIKPRLVSIKLNKAWFTMAGGLGYLGGRVYINIEYVVINIYIYIYIYNIYRLWARLG
jgi:hypothetical protein